MKARKDGVWQSPRTLERFFVIEQLSKMNESDAARTCWLRLPVGPPFPKNELLECVNADCEGIGLPSFRILGHRHIALSEITSVDLVRMTGTSSQEQSDLADGPVGTTRRHGNVVLGRTDGHDGV